MANLLFVGPTGSGKTLIAKKLAEEIFGDEKALIRIDMSEYSEKNSVAKLTGAAPGYIGYENGGQLTEAVKNKQHCVLLLDEIEKADQEVYNIFLQLFDEGRLTDSAGQVVNFKNVIVLMTSNIGARKAAELGNGLGFVSNEDSNKKSIIDKELKKKFTPEFINRLDQIVYFNSLSDDNLKDIVKLEINKFNKRLNNLEYNITYTDDVVTYIHARALEKKELGARPIIRLIQTEIEDKITDLMLENDYPRNYAFSASCDGDEVKVV
jgi:ATP-dependent Clp protease ATP-binding subunit ClpC